MAVTMAKPVDRSAFTASRIRDIRNMKLPMTAKATTGMATGNRLSAWFRCSLEATAVTTKTVISPTTTPTIVIDGP